MWNITKLIIKNIEDLLKDKGHKTKCFNFGGSTVQGVQVVDKSIYAYSDPRKGLIKIGKLFFIFYQILLIFILNFVIGGQPDGV